MKRIRVTSKAQQLVRYIGPAEAIVDPALVAIALGAEPIATTTTGLVPPSFVALREEITKRLTSGWRSCRGRIRDIRRQIDEAVDAIERGMMRS